MAGMEKVPGGMLRMKRKIVLPYAQRETNDSEREAA
jgi:hypothetical protein